MQAFNDVYQRKHMILRMFLAHRFGKKLVKNIS